MQRKGASDAPLALNTDIAAQQSGQVGADCQPQPRSFVTPRQPFVELLKGPEQAAKVMLASEMGTVNLVMRSPEDERQVADAQAKPSELLGAPAVAEHAPPPSPPEPLVSVKTLPAPEEMQTTDSAKPRQVWAMRVIKANEVGEVRFEQDEPAADGSAGLELWKTTTSAEVPGKSKTDSHPATENAVIDLPKNQDSNRSKTEGDRAI